MFKPIDDFDWFENVTFAPAGSSAQESGTLEDYDVTQRTNISKFRKIIFVLFS